MPEIVLIAPGGMASKAVFSASKPRPEMMSVLKVVRPPLGTWRAMMANQISQVLISSRASQICSILKVLDSRPVLSIALRWMSMYFSRSDSHFASSGLFGLMGISDMVGIEF